MPSWNPYPGGQIYIPPPNPADQVNTYPRFQEPVQGNCDNCHFVAALSSMAWVNPQKIVASLTRINNNPVTDQVKFYNPNQNVAMNETVWIDGANYLYTRSVDYAAGELWPALYEKAYVKLLDVQYAKDPEPRDPGTAAWGQKSIIPLQKISGYAPVAQYITGEPFPGGGPYHDWFDVIATYCDVFNANSSQAKFPGIVWSGAHTFSILGLHNEGGKWIIVRDPAVNNNRRPAGYLTDANWNVTRKNWDGGVFIPGTATGIAVPLANGVFGVNAVNFAGFVSNIGIVGAPRRW